MDTVQRDLRLAIRTLRANPGFALTVILSIGIGIGANTTVFAWIDNIARRPFPAIPDGGRLVALNVGDQDGAVEGMAPIAYPTLQDWVARTDAFSSVAAHAQTRLNLRTGPADAGEPVWVEITSANFFATLGIRPARGRFFSDADEQAGAAVVVLSDRFWRRRLGGAADVVGRPLLLNGVPATVIGIGPPRFGGVVTGLAFDAWVPLWHQRTLMPGADWMRDRSARRMQAIARLRSGTSLAEARRQLNAGARAVSQSFGETPLTGAGARWITDTQLGSLMGPLGTAMIGVTIVILLTACANVAGLLLARGVAVQHETAVQIAVGASRCDVVRPALVQAALLGLVGGGVGLWIARITKDALPRFIPRVPLPVSLEIDLNWRVILFAAGLAISATVVFAVLPALRASRPNVVDALKGSPRAGGRRTRWRRALVVAQVSLSLMSLTTAALFLRSAVSARALPLGFEEPARVLLVSTDLSFTRLSGAPLAALVDLTLERVRNLPGVEQAALASFVPLGFGGPPGVTTRVEGYTPGPREAMFVARAVVSDGYFETMGMGLAEGRGLAATDRASALRVAVVNEAFAARFWPGRSAIGRRLDQGDGWRVVIGVVRNAAVDNLGAAPRPLVYQPWAQQPVTALTLHVRSAGAAPLGLVEPVRRALARVHPDMPALDPGTLADHMQAAVFVQAVGAQTFSLFAIVALSITSVGLYGVVAQHVAERRREIAIAAALGAPPRRLAAAVTSPALRLSALGLGIGAALSAAAARLVRTLLIGVPAIDPVSIAGAVAVLASVAVVSCAWPARQVARTDCTMVVRD